MMMKLDTQNDRNETVRVDELQMPMNSERTGTEQVLWENWSYG